MGNIESSFELGRSLELKFPAAVYVVANAEDVAALEAAATRDELGGATLVPLAASAEVPAQVLSAARVLVMEVDPADRASLRRIAQVRSARADLPVIAAVRDATIALVRTLVRQGVSDVALLPFNAEELVGQVLDAAARVEERREADLPLAPMTCVVRSTGGCGSTSVITHLAAALAREADGGSVCVIDLDLQGGCVSSYLGIAPTITAADLIEAGDRLDAEFLRSAVTDSKRGFSVIGAPDAITPLESIDTDQVLRLLTLARQEFGQVLIDLPANWTNWALSAALSSTDVLLVTDLSIASLRQARRRMDLFSTVGIDQRRIAIAVNRVERKLFKTISVDEAANALHCEVIASLSAETPGLTAAQDQGMLAGEIGGKSRFAADVAGLAQQLLARR